MLKKKRHDTLKIALTVLGQGDRIKFDVTYKNLKQVQLDELNAKPGLIMGELVLALIDSWDCEYDLNIEGITELEDDRPGMIEALLAGFYEARRMNKIKN